MTTITIEQVSKSYPTSLLRSTESITAVDGISIKILPGEVVAVLGPSGCGKTTLMRLMAGLLKPDNGRVLYDNVPVQDVPVEDRGIGIAFQSGGLHPLWKTRRSVGFYLDLRNRGAELPERLERISEITGLGMDQLLERRPGQLSYGEIQRVVIARALARDLKVLLLDEPFVNMDAHLRANARLELKRLLNEFPTTTVYFTHEQDEALSLADRTAVMRSGRFEQIGSMKQLYRSPVNIFVASFIGVPQINLFEGRAHQGRWQGTTFGDFPLRSDLVDGFRVTLGVRPDDVLIDEEGYETRVEMVTPLYPERRTLVEVSRAGEKWQLYTPLEPEHRIGDALKCSLDASALLFFDTDSGRRIG